MQIEREIAPRGSALYYSLRKVTGPARSAILAIESIAQALKKTSEKHQHLDAASAKLNWWHQEIEWLFAEKATHPYTQALAPFIKTFQLKANTLLALVEAATLSMQTQVFSQQTELAQHYQHTGGIVEGLKAGILADGQFNSATQKYAHYLGISLEVVRHINHFADFYYRGRLYLPEDALSTIGLSAKQALDPQCQAELLPLLKEQASYARETFKLAKKHLPDNAVKRQRPGLILGTLAMKTLDAIEKNHFKVFEHQIKLSPITLLWQSLRV